MQSGRCCEQDTVFYSMISERNNFNHFESLNVVQMPLIMFRLNPSYRLGADVV